MGRLLRYPGTAPVRHHGGSCFHQGHSLVGGSSTGFLAEKLDSRTGFNRGGGHRSHYAGTQCPHWFISVHGGMVGSGGNYIGYFRQGERLQ